MVKGFRILYGKGFMTHFDHTITSSQAKNALTAQAGPFGVRLLKKPSVMTDRNFVIHWGTGSMMMTHGNGSITLGKTDCIVKWGTDGSFGLWNKEGDVAGRQHWHYQLGGQSTDSIQGLHRATVRQHNDFMLLTGASTSPTNCTNSSTHDRFQAFLHSHPNQWCFEHLLHLNDIDAAAQAIADSTAIAVSDGSFKDGHSTASFIITTLKHTFSIQGDVISPGDSAIQEAYQSELAGLLGTVLLVKAIVSFYDLSHNTCAVTIACDGLYALLNSFDTSHPITVDKNHYDLLWAIRSKLEDSRISWHFQHVKGIKMILATWKIWTSGRN
jgi:hypothetical protein